MCQCHAVSCVWCGVRTSDPQPVSWVDEQGAYAFTVCPACYEKGVA